MDVTSVLQYLDLVAIGIMAVGLASALVAVVVLIYLRIRYALS